MVEDLAIETFDKPGFDGRQQYYKLVGIYMTSIAQSQTIHDYKAWINNINGLFDLVIAFVKDASKLKEQINLTEKFVDSFYGTCSNKQNQLMMDRVIEQKLHDLTQTLYISAKHMLVPIKDSDETEYSTDDFLKGSDL